VIVCAWQDLLQPQNNDLQIREGEDGVFVAGVHEVEVKTMEDCLHLLQVGERNRHARQLTKRRPLQQ
jgi:kinesin family protein 5